MLITVLTKQSFMIHCYKHPKFTKHELYYPEKLQYIVYTFQITSYL